jgi:hypothetical protein
MKKNDSSNKIDIVKRSPFLSEKTIAFIIIAVVSASILFTGKLYRSNKLEKEKTNIVTAQIIEVGTRWGGGTRLSKKGYIKFQYTANDGKISGSIESFQIRDNLNQYHVGDCIELTINSENKEIFKWNELKGSFKCP